jgi:hypothetical protein
VPLPEKVANDGRGDGGGENNSESAETVTKCYNAWERRDREPRDEPSREKPNPPGGQKADLGDEYPRGQAEVRVVELSELEASKILMRN